MWVSLFVIALAATTCTAQLLDVIQTQAGPVQGFIRNTSKVWLGIPFAKPPVGNLRFQHPVKPDSWTTVLNATQYSLACPQGNAQTPLPPAQGEDCLYLNVYAPLNTNTSKGGAGTGLPVYVYIFGGAWTVGYTQKYDGAELAGQDIIVVNMNYRLGLLGYMAHPVLLTGNPVQNTTGMYAIQDQRMALQWVQDNIAKFGGDPTRVTLGGQSAGGNAAIVQLVAPRSAGLFKQLLISSGLYTMTETAVGYAAGTTAIAKLGCNFTTDADTLACLRNVSASAIVAAAGSIRPVISEWEFLGQPTVRVAAGTFNNVTLFVGTNSNESSTQGTWCDNTTASTWNSTAADYYKFANATYPTRLEEFLSTYPLANYPTPVSARIAVASDNTFICGAKGFWDLYSTLNSNVYAYRFTHSPVYPTIKNAAVSCLGAGHGFEMYDVFPSYFRLWSYGNGTYTAAEETLKTDIRAAWVSFITNGVPKSNSGSAWPKYTFQQASHVILETGTWTVKTYMSPTCTFFGVPNSPSYVTTTTGSLSTTGSTTSSSNSTSSTTTSSSSFTKPLVALVSFCILLLSF